MALKSMHPDIFLDRDPFGHQELKHSVSLVPLELHDVTVNIVMDNRAITFELVLQMSRYPFHIEDVRDSTDGCDTLSTVALLGTDMYESSSRGIRTGIHLFTFCT
eukprot:GHVH01010656.1.p2 GENE.GHVH01010656.1~~GHVH01010656.1.p2  ORF type:complete len:105 (-),score=9.25 GHVH01010656.1:991-1305(-)